MNGLSEKADITFTLANSLPAEELMRVPELAAGYDEERDTWELIVKYQGDLKAYESNSIQIEELIFGYAIVTTDRDGWIFLSGLREVEYIEKPRPIFSQAILGQESSCITPVKKEPYRLTGRGVLAAVIDSSVDFENVHFRKEDKTTRILALWDQNAEGEGRPPEGFAIGREYNAVQINETLDGARIVTTQDVSGHGTAVAGILAGGKTDVFEGVATECSLLVVKLRQNVGEPFTQSADIMRAVAYCLKKAKEFGMPLVINLSYGTVWGSHKGDSLLERFINNASEIGKTCIVVGSGNEGNSGRHYRKKGQPKDSDRVELTVEEYDFGFGIHIFYPGAEKYRFSLITPYGDEIILPELNGLYRGEARGIVVETVSSEATPYASFAEVYMQVVPRDLYVPAGTWYLEIIPVRSVTGEVDIYLSGTFSANRQTRFVQPEQNLTLTIPSTAERVITVGAYSAYNNGYASFSGQGEQGRSELYSPLKPDILAPGVEVRTIRRGGGYTNVTGTSFAAPFVSGSIALLMEWAIIKGNDPYLYGEKMKALLQGSARKQTGLAKIPNAREGWGFLCLADAFRIL